MFITVSVLEKASPEQKASTLNDSSNVLTRFTYADQLTGLNSPQ